MRDAFVAALTEAAREDGRIFLLTGDLGFSVFEGFASEFPGRFINAGVAEQNMVGMATGLALSGKIVFTYSIATFMTQRCTEQIRVDVCYHNANVKIVGVGGGLAYGALGPTHHATEDIAMMRTMAGMAVICPADPVEVRLAVPAMIARPGPAYLRLGRNRDPLVHPDPPSFNIGRAITVRKGSDVTLVTTGSATAEALGAAQELEAAGVSVRVISMHTVKPLDVDAVLTAARETRAIFTVEEHIASGGLGGAVAEVLAESRGRPPIFRRIGLPNEFAGQIGSQEYLREAGGVSAGAIRRAVIEALASGAR